MLKKFLVIFIISAGLVPAQNPIAKQFSNEFAEIVEKANPAVVTVLSEKPIQFSGPMPFDFFFPTPRGGQDPHPRYSTALGSGVIVDAAKGYILTNNHVVSDARTVRIELIDKRVLKAEVIGVDPRSDLAVLKIENGNLHELKLGNSDKVRVGEWVLAVGSPFSANLSHSVTAGIVSALGRSNIMSGDNYEDFIQTDAAINPGNSGGALLNIDGELIGINTAIATGGFDRANKGVGFAIPSNMAKKVMNDLIDKGYVVRSWLGVYIQEVDDRMARALGLESRAGALINGVVDDSPAKKSGLEEGDIIVRFEGESVRDPAHLKNLVSSTSPGTRTKIIINRNGREKSLTVILEELKQDDTAVLASSTRQEKLGIDVQALTNDIAAQLGIDSDDEGVVVSDVKRGSPAYREGIRVGQLITRVGHQPVTTPVEFNEAVMEQSKDRDSVILLVKQKNISRFIAIDLKE